MIFFFSCVRRLTTGAIAGVFAGVFAAGCNVGVASAQIVSSSSPPSRTARFEATIFSPGVISDRHEQWRITFTPDGRTAYFAESAEFAVRSHRGFRSREALPSAVNTTPSATDASPQSAWDFNPEISADGKTLLFTSLRPGHGLGDLYVSHFRHGRWSQAENLGPQVNTAADEFHPTLSRNKGELYFVRRVPGRGDFYVIASKAIAALRR